MYCRDNNSDSSNDVFENKEKYSKTEKYPPHLCQSLILRISLIRSITSTRNTIDSLSGGVFDGFGNLALFAITPLQILVVIDALTNSLPINTKFIAFVTTLCFVRLSFACSYLYQRQTCNNKCCQWY